MGVSVGTIVTRYDAYEGVISCEPGEMHCVGHIVEIDSHLAHPDNPVVVVKWLHSCSYHANKPNMDMRHLLDETYEIGQLLAF